MVLSGMWQGYIEVQLTRHPLLICTDTFIFIETGLNFQLEHASFIQRKGGLNSCYYGDGYNEVPLTGHPVFRRADNWS